LKQGIETNVEVWFVRGEPRFAFMQIESKKKLTGDLDDLTGCAFDFMFEVPLVDGTFTPNFARGLGASCTTYMDHRLSGKAIQFPAAIERHLYFYDAHRDGELLLTSGYYDDVLVATAYGEAIPTAWDAALATARAVKFPGRFRIDGGGTDFPSSPLRRYDALRRMGYL
jgi:hypothetical protein